METRADRIYSLFDNQGVERLSVGEIAKKIAEAEGVSKLHPSIISSTVRQDNKSRDLRGLAPRFNHSGDGNEERGFISIRKNIKASTSIKNVVENAEEQIPLIIEKSNHKVKVELKKAILNLSWQEFESNFLVQIMEALGFRSIEITQKTRDGGKDAICKYKRGVVESEAIISAKKWTKQKVSADEVQRLRGIRGNADTAIIFTSSKFTPDAIKEAMPSQNQRSVVLIDGDLIVETCFSSGIGVKEIKIPTLYEFVGFEEENDG